MNTCMEERLVRQGDATMAMDKGKLNFTRTEKNKKKGCNLVFVVALFEEGLL